jgi:hypothetical protein
MRRALLALVLFVAAAVSLGFLLLPIVALFTQQQPGELFHQLSNPVVTDALVVSPVSYTQLTLPTTPYV